MKFFKPLPKEEDPDKVKKRRDEEVFKTIEKMEDNGDPAESIEHTGKDIRMRFRNSQDPLYVAYDYIGKQKLDKLAEAFWKEFKHDFKKFIKNLKNLY